MYKNRYAAPDGTEYDGCGEFESVKKALDCASSALDHALPGTRWIGTRPWGLERREARHAA